MPNRRNGTQRSFLFELTPNGAEPMPGGQGSRSGGGRGGGGRGGKGGGRRPNGGRGQHFTPVQVLDPIHNPVDQWNGVDFDTIASMVPQVERGIVMTTCERERARGASLQDTLDALLRLGLEASAGTTSSAAATTSVQPSTTPTAHPLPLDVSDDATTSAPIAAPALGAADGVAANPAPPSCWLARLPDELLAGLFTQMGAGYMAVGQLGLVCRETNEMTTRWLATEVRSLRITSRLRRWNDLRVVGLIRATSSGLERLEIDCAAEADKQAARSHPNLPWEPVYQTRNWSGFTSFLHLATIALPKLRLLRLEGAMALDENATLALVSSCTHLTALSLIGCPQLTDRAALAVTDLTSLTELNLSRNPQLSARVCKILACCAPAMVKLDFSHCGEGLFEPFRPLSKRHVIPATPRTSMSDASVLQLEELVDLSTAGTRRLGWDVCHLGTLHELGLVSWRSLRELALSGTNAPKLRKLDLAACEQLGYVTLKALPELHFLNASGCPQLHTLDVQDCPDLSQLKLAQCKSLRHLTAPHSSRLATLSLFGCRVVSTATLEALLRVAGHSLASLDLNGTFATQSLTEASIRQQCPRLEHLDAKGRVLKF